MKPPDNATSPQGAEPQSDGARAGMGLINLGWVAWGRSWKRNQSMVYQLSRTPLFDRTVFVNPRGLWLGPQILMPGKEGLRERFHRIVEALPRRHDSLRVLSHWHFIPLKSRSARARELEDQLFVNAVLRHLDGRPFVLLNNHPNFEVPAILRELMERAALRVFDLSDDFVEYFSVERHREVFRRNLEFCCSRSDLVFAVNDHVAAKYCGFNDNTVVVPNSTNFENFHRDAYAPVPALQRIAASGGPLFGCTGIINRIRVDYDLVEFLATRRPDSHFVFVGSADASFVTLAGRHDNVHHFPQVPYPELPNWINHFQATIIPFLSNEHTAGNDLLKFHDYLAMGKPVVTTDMGGASRYEGLVHIASDHEGFLRALDDALVPASQDVVDQRIDVARRNSWSARAHQIECILRAHLERVSPC